VTGVSSRPGGIGCVLHVLVWAKCGQKHAKLNSVGRGGCWCAHTGLDPVIAILEVCILVKRAAPPCLLVCIAGTGPLKLPVC
jgi:hypothetical protein